MAQEKEPKERAELLPGGISQKQVDGWKAKHGRVYRIDVKAGAGGEVLHGYFAKPDRAVLSMMAKYAASDPMRSNEMLVENCWLGGDDRIRTVDEYFLSAAGQLGEVIKVAESELVEL